MSRVAKKPIILPKGVEVNIQGQLVTVKGGKGSLVFDVPAGVAVAQDANVLTFEPRDAETFSNAMAGTARALVNNMVTGVSTGFQKKLELVGVGYRAQVQGSKLNLTLGFSHPIVFEAPKGISIETPSQTEVLVKGIDKHQVGLAAAKIRAYRPPEPYKGKGVRYSDEVIVRKEAKKK